MTPFHTICYVGSYLLAFLSLMLAPRSRQSLNPIAWIAATFFCLMSIDGLAAGALTLAGIPTNIVTTSLFHVIIFLACIVFMGVRHEVQRYRVASGDVIALVSIAILVALCARVEFGPNLTIHYLASDAAVHLDRAREIVEKQSVYGMFVAWNFLAGWISAATPFLSSVEIYKVLIFCDVAFLFFGGLLFYGFLNECEPRPSIGVKLLFVAATFAYLLGYPLNNMIFGFFYLGVGVSMAIGVAFFCVCILNGSTPAAYVGLGGMLFGLITSYALFAPTIYLASFACLAVAWYRRGVLVSRTSVLTSLLAFGATGLLGVYFSYIGTFPAGSSVTAGAAISWDGGIYRNLYSNQILLLPFAVAGGVSARLHQSRRPAAYLLIGIAATLAVCFLLTFPNIISTYYFFKFYYLMAPFMMACAIFGVLQVARGASKPFLAGCVATICALIGINVTQLDQRLVNLMPRMNYGVVASYQPFFDIYTWNDSYLRPGSEFDPGTLAVYEQANHFAGNSDRPIAFLGNIEQYYWWIALVRQDYVPGIRPWETATVDEAVQEITVQCDYVVVLTREPFESVGSIESRTAAEKLSSNLEVIWSNDAGYIARITH